MTQPRATDSFWKLWPMAGALATLALSAAPVVAQSITAPSSPELIRQREQELEAIRSQQKSAAEQQEKLKAEIAAIGEDHAKLNEQLIDIAARVRHVETRIGEAEARLAPLDQREQQIRASLEARRGEIALVLLDLTMPDLDGEETFHELRQIDPNVRVVMSSGYTESEIIPRFAGQGLTGFLQKPYTTAALIECLRGSLGGSESS